MKNGRWAIYPEHRFFTESQLRMMLSDAIANGEIDSIGNRPGVSPEESSIQEICEILEDGGRITFASPDVQDSAMQERAYFEFLDRD